MTENRWPFLHNNTSFPSKFLSGYLHHIIKFIWHIYFYYLWAKRQFSLWPSSVSLLLLLSNSHSSLFFAYKTVPFVPLYSSLKYNISPARLNFGVFSNISHSLISCFKIIYILMNEDKYSNIFFLNDTFRLYSNLQLS